MNFLTNTNNLLLIAILITSGLALAVPQLLGRLNRQLLSVHAAVQWVNQRGAQMVDVRSVEEFKSGHVANSKNLPFADIQDPVQQLHLDTNKPVILICLSGSRASGAVGKFKKAGFSEVACMEGGVNAWTQASLPLVQ